MYIVKGRYSEAVRPCMSEALKRIIAAIKAAKHIRIQNISRFISCGVGLNSSMAVVEFIKNLYHSKQLAFPLVVKS